MGAEIRFPGTAMIFKAVKQRDAEQRASVNRDLCLAFLRRLYKIDTQYL